MQLIQEAQEEERRNPMSAEAFKAESERLARYGQERLKAVGMDTMTEEEFDEMLYAERKAR